MIFIFRSFNLFWNIAWYFVHFFRFVQSFYKAKNEEFSSLIYSFFFMFHLREIIGTLYKLVSVWEDKNVTRVVVNIMRKISKFY